MRKSESAWLTVFPMLARTTDGCVRTATYALIADFTPPEQAATHSADSNGFGERLPPAEFRAVSDGVGRELDRDVTPTSSETLCRDRARLRWNHSRHPWVALAITVQEVTQSADILTSREVDPETWTAA